MAAGSALSPQIHARRVQQRVRFADFRTAARLGSPARSFHLRADRDASLLGSDFPDGAGQWVDRTSLRCPDSSGCLRRKALTDYVSSDGKPDVFFACHGYDFPGGPRGSSSESF